MRRASQGHCCAFEVHAGSKVPRSVFPTINATAGELWVNVAQGFTIKNT